MRHTLYMPYFHSMRANSGHERSPMRILKGLAAKSDLPTQEKDTPLFGAGAGRATDDECGNDGLAAPLF